ncbi:MAG: hypothetical protein M1469_02335 [Bacteroidetes bacterium]|nr:hypothetical protein [Bacteroidota bacterium]
MEQTGLPAEIANELSAGQKALDDGNDGKARVCGRRAVGKAFARSRYSKGIAGTISSIESLKLISTVEELSAEVRDAARRLSLSVADTSARPISTEPIKDALVIVHALLRSQK